MRAGAAGVACLVAALLFFPGCDKGSPAGDAAPRARAVSRVPAVRLHTITAVDVADEIRFSGTVAPSRKTMISPKILGTIEAITKQEGDPIRAGEVLVRLERADYELALRQAQAQLAVAEAHLAQARQAVRSTKRPRARLRRLRAADSVPDAALDEIDARYEMTVKTVAVARANAELARVGVDAAERQLGYTEVTAPFDGVVLKRLVDEGEIARALPPTVVLVVAEVPPFYVLGSVNEIAGVRLTPGTTLVVRPDAAPEAVIEASVTQTGAMVDPETRSLPIRARVTRGAEHLRVGMSAELVAQLGRRSRLVVPRVALMNRTGAGAEVFVVSARDGEHRAERRHLALGAPRGDGVFVEAGLREGERVVVAGHPDVVDGAPVRPVSGTTRPAASEERDGAVARQVSESTAP